MKPFLLMMLGLVLNPKQERFMLTLFQGCRGQVEQVHVDVDIVHVHVDIVHCYVVSTLLNPTDTEMVFRYEYGEMNITKLNQRIDDIEDEIYREKLKVKKVSDELSETFDDMLDNY